MAICGTIATRIQSHGDILMISHLCLLIPAINVPYYIAGLSPSLIMRSPKGNSQLDIKGDVRISVSEPRICYLGDRRLVIVQVQNPKDIAGIYLDIDATPGLRAQLPNAPIIGPMLLR